MDYSVRVYVLEDTDSSMETVFGQEKRLGGRLLDEPRSVAFQDGGNNLCLSLENVSEGWRPKPASDYQEIPFRHLWQANSNSLHCSFTLESSETNRNLSFRIRVNQKGFDGHQTFEVTCRDEGEGGMEKGGSARFNRNELVTKGAAYSDTSRSGDSKKSVEYARSAKSGKSLIVTDRGVSTCDDFNFR